jgi:hypothetical protein
MLFDNLGLSRFWSVGPPRVSEDQQSKGLTTMTDLKMPNTLVQVQVPLERKELSFSNITASRREP